MAESEAPIPVREGEVLAGKYRIERVLGAGGMGVVVAATHLQLEQRVALKFVLPSAAKNAEVIERFTREARAAAKLRSEHVMRVLDVCALEDGTPYMVMEYLEGRDLGAEVEARGALPFEEVAEYVLQACEAIAEAHAVGIIHRDLKPQNLFLTQRVDGRPLVKVLDFGISKFSGSTSGENMSLTKTHTVMGSPSYMSPEQLRSSRGVDARSDIWALGVILYELLTGQVPFVATAMTELCAMVLQDTPRSIREQRPDVPEGLAAVVLRCLEKDPNARFQSIANLAHALEPFARAATPKAAERIRAVARESSARGAGGSVPPPGPSGAAVVPGKTSVSWATTELAARPRRRVLPYAAAVAGALLVGAAAIVVVVRVVLPHFREPPVSAAAAAPPPAPVAAAGSTTPAAPRPAASDAPPREAGTADAATPAPMPSPHAVDAGRPPAPGPHPPKKPKHPDQDTPDERN